MGSSGNPTSAAIVGTPTNGTVSAPSGKSVTFTPTTGFSGAGTFNFTLSTFQSIKSNTATATVNVAAGAPPPPPPGFTLQINAGGPAVKPYVADTDFIWLLRSLKPDFKTIADFRSDDRAAFKKVFRDFVILCRRLDLFGRESGDPRLALKCVDELSIRAHLEVPRTTRQASRRKEVSGNAYARVFGRRRRETVQAQDNRSQHAFTTCAGPPSELAQCPDSRHHGGRKYLVTRTRAYLDGGAGKQSRPKTTVHNMLSQHAPDRLPSWPNVQTACQAKQPTRQAIAAKF
jgi:hypothetical protein